MPTLWVTGSDGALVALEAEGYATEREFQALLATNPEVLASAVDSGGEGSRWLLVDRELPILASEEGESNRWSLDHLFIGTDGSPVLVEVKRSSDPRARREVVGQMLDYAASFASDWSAERLRGRWEQQVAASRSDRDDLLEAFLDATGFEGEEHLWAEVQAKIDAGRIRLLFVADRLSPTLVRIIDYLNGQLRHTEVLGVEVVRHADAGAGIVAYEPVVRGRSAVAIDSPKRSVERRTAGEFEEVLTVTHGQDVLASVKALIDGAVERGAFVTIGTSARSPRLFLNFRTGGSGRTYWPIAINPRAGKFVLFLRYLRHHPAFEDEGVRAEFVDRIGEAIGQAANGDNLGGFPWFPVGALTRPGVTDRILDVLGWIVATADLGMPCKLREERTIDS